MNRKPNVELLEQVYDTIKKERKNWRQSVWAIAKRKRGETTPPESCGSAFCFAGHAVAMQGAKIFWEPGTQYNGHPVWEAYECRLPHYRRESISAAAQRVLGLNPDQASALFAGNNGLKTIRKILDRIEAGDNFSGRWGIR